MREAWLCTNTLPTMVHDQAVRIITWQPNGEDSPYLPPGTHWAALCAKDEPYESWLLINEYPVFPKDIKGVIKSRKSNARQYSGLHNLNRINVLFSHTWLIPQRDWNIEMCFEFKIMLTVNVLLDILCPFFSVKLMNCCFCGNTMINACKWEVTQKIDNHVFVTTTGPVPLMVDY